MFKLQTFEWSTVNHVADACKFHGIQAYFSVDPVIFHFRICHFPKEAKENEKIKWEKIGERWGKVKQPKKQQQRQKVNQKKRWKKELNFAGFVPIR